MEIVRPGLAFVLVVAGMAVGCGGSQDKKAETVPSASTPASSPNLNLYTKPETREALAAKAFAQEGFAIVGHRSSSESVSASLAVPDQMKTVYNDCYAVTLKGHTHIFEKCAYIDVAGNAIKTDQEIDLGQDISTLPGPAP
jgi:hypothetical protein